jgi:hypothetical protein
VVEPQVQYFRAHPEKRAVYRFHLNRHEVANSGTFCLKLKFAQRETNLFKNVSKMLPADKPVLVVPVIR